MSRSPEEIDAEIEARREHLADTLDQLAARLDVKSRARARLRATSPVVYVGFVAGVAAVGLLVWRRRAR
jgi:uncharacterized protein DUF3618